MNQANQKEKSQQRQPGEISNPTWKIDDLEADNPFSKKDKTPKTDMECDVFGDPFARRDSITRTPPRMRSHSISGPVKLTTQGDSQSLTEQTFKRKRQESPTEPSKKTVISGDTLMSIIGKMYKEIKVLEKTISSMYNPKKELKEVTCRLLYQAEVLNSSDVGTLLKDVQDSYNRGHVQATEKLRVKCKNCEKAQKMNDRRAQLKGEETFENFQSVTEDDWKEGIFEEPQRVKESIKEFVDDWDIILPCNKQIQSTYKDIDRAIGESGGRNGLLKQDKKEGELALMYQSTGFPDTDGNINPKTRWVYCPIMGEDSSKSDRSDRAIFESLALVKSHMTANGRRRLAVPEMGDVLGATIVRMLQFLFAGTPTHWVVCKNTSSFPRARTKSTSVQQPGSQVQTKKFKDDAILVHMEGKSYADLLKTIKTAINPSEIGVDVKSLRKTRKDEVLLTIGNGTDKADILKKELMEKVPQIVTRHIVKKKVLHIKHMDEVVTEDEIRDAVNKTIGTNEPFDIRALRPAYGNRKNATIIMREDDAIKLIQLGKIKIGWTSCKVYEREKEARCFRCWEYGHTKSQCKGPNREQFCLKCGTEGHKIRDCKNNSRCILCDQEGHRTGDPTCPKRGKPTGSK